MESKMFGKILEWISGHGETKSVLSKSEIILNTPIKENLEIVEDDFRRLKETTKSLAETAENLSKILERKLELSEAKFNLVENSIDDIIVVKTSNRKIININDYTCKIFGLNKEECLGKTNEDLIKIFPNLKSTLKIFSKNESKSLKENTPLKFDVEIEIDKKKVPFVVCVNPIETEDMIEKELIIIGYNKEKKF